MLSWKVKICGITNPVDARAAVEFGADALGLNFYARSLRSVSSEKALTILEGIPSGVTRVGVFVNESNDTVNRLTADLSLDAVQLHGDESPDCMVGINCEVIRAVRIMPGQWDSAQNEMQAWVDAGAVAVLLDAGGGGKYGGSGKQLDWDRVVQLPRSSPMILAGGLNCENVAQAIATAKPDAVDVASGVEKFPGKKDHDLLRRFIEAARDGLPAREPPA